MQNYQYELDYQLDLIRQSGPAGVPKMAALILDELARGLASGNMPLDEVERKKSLFYSLALEIKDLPDALGAFRWARFYRAAKMEHVDSYGHLYWEAMSSIVRAECGFIEPYLTVQLSEVQSLLEHHGML
jgi:hypothetical protein